MSSYTRGDLDNVLGELVSLQRSNRWQKHKSKKKKKPLPTRPDVDPKLKPKNDRAFEEEVCDLLLVGMDKPKACCNCSSRIVSKGVIALASRSMRPKTLACLAA